MNATDRELLRYVAWSEDLALCLIDLRHGAVKVGEPFCLACCDEIEGAQ